MILKTIILGTLGVIIAVMLASTITWEVPDVETYVTFEPYNYEQSIVHESQEKRFLWFFEFTQVQCIVKNTDTKGGNFSLNFIFDNGEKTVTKTKTVEIMAGEKKAVAMDSPIGGKSSVTLNVIPPSHSIPHERTVMKEVTVLDYIGLGWLRLFFK